MKTNVYIVSRNENVCLHEWESVRAQYLRDTLCLMGRSVDVDELIDARDVAKILGLQRSTSVFVYLTRYPSMPRPVVDRGDNRAKLWVRADVEAWQAGGRK